VVPSNGVGKQGVGGLGGGGGNRRGVRPGAVFQKGGGGNVPKGPGEGVGGGTSSRDCISK